MPSGNKINWSKYDQLIIEKLPQYTISEFTSKYLPNISSKAVGSRAKKLGIKPSKKLSKSHKNNISKSASNKLPDDTVKYIIDNINKISRKQIAKDCQTSLYHVNKIVKEHNIILDKSLPQKIAAEKGKEHIHKAQKAAKEMWGSEEYRDKMSKLISTRNKKLWDNEEYRLKVRNGIRQAYDNTDLRDRISKISKERYDNNESVRNILSADRPFKNSKLNDRVADILEWHKISFDREYEIANYKFDFKIGKILLEINGDYWHSLEDNKRNDAAKRTIIERYYPDFKVKTIWESELRSIRGSERLLWAIERGSITPTIISLKDLSIAEASYEATYKFIVSNHYLGPTNRSKYYLTLLLHGEAVAIATYGSPIRQNIGKDALELVRLCRSPYAYNKNMLSYFLSKCEKWIKKNTDAKFLVSYADTRLHNGAVYKAANWVMVGETKPDYQYLSADNIPIHKKTLYNRAIAEGLKEREYAEKYNFKKTSSGTKLKFIRNLN